MVEVNGPPFQRYVHPKVDLAKQRNRPPSGGIVVATARYVDELWRAPAAGELGHAQTAVPALSGVAAALRGL